MTMFLQKSRRTRARSIENILESFNVVHVDFDLDLDLDEIKNKSKIGRTFGAA
jgi:hypothetical protein